MPRIGRCGKLPAALKLISWNVAGRTKDLADQVAALARQEPDLVCLQEVRPSTRGRFAATLSADGLGHAADSSRFRNDRRLFNLTVSRWPFVELAAIGAPFPERVLSLVVDTPDGPLELHNAHIPSARSRGFIKVETCEAIHERLARPSDRHRVLCGDLNLPRAETPAGEVVTFAADHPESLERWDAAERSILPGLAAWDLSDFFATSTATSAKRRAGCFTPGPAARQGCESTTCSPPRACGRGGANISMAGASRASPTIPPSRRSYEPA